MTEALVLLLFCATILSCVFTGHSVIFALVFGFFLFTGYGLYKGFSLKALYPMMTRGVKAVASIALVLALIGMLTGSWRASGTVARLVSDAALFITPEWCLLAVFIFNGLLSTLIGTSFGTAATMGVISMTMTDAMGISPLLAGGAILSGIYVGDRCSPVSTSAALVCAVTRTNIYTNMKLMVISGAVPFAAAAGLYALLGWLSPGSAVSLDVAGIFRRVFTLDAFTFIPAVVLLALVFMKVSIKWTMAASIASAALVCAFVQGTSWTDIARTLITGYTSADPDIARMLSGGGLVSMLPVCAIILISSTFSGLIEGTGLISSIKDRIPKLSARITPFGTIVVTAFVTAAIACNQVLCVMLTNQLCGDIRKDRQKMAISLENSSIVIAPIIPWSIAGAVPIATVGAPVLCVLTAFYLWFLPLWQFLTELVDKKRR